MSKAFPKAEDLFLTLKDAIGEQVSDQTAMVGIHTGGVWVARRLHKMLGLNLPLGEIDVAFYRDDFAHRGLKSRVQPSSIEFEVDDREILLIDDVLYSGRTVRAAMNEIFDHGRPKKVMLGVLLDRGGRQLPIDANFVGGNVYLREVEKIALTKTDDGLFEFVLRSGLET